MKFAFDDSQKDVSANLKLVFVDDVISVWFYTCMPGKAYYHGNIIIYVTRFVG